MRTSLPPFFSPSPYVNSPKYFKKVRLSPSAAMKMLMHACGGVEKGMKVRRREGLGEGKRDGERDGRREDG